MFLADLKTFDLPPDRKYTFLVSIGSLEQHGPYAPLGTDTFIHDALLQQVNVSVPNIIFLPTIPIGASEVQLGFFGSISFKEETVYSIVNDIVKSISSYASSILFVSWHGGNKPVFDRLIKENQSHFSEIKLIHISFGDESTDLLAKQLIEGELDDHAGNTEVAMMLALRPDITKQPAEGSQKKAIKSFSWDKPILSVTSEGIIDANPNWKATSQIGKELIDIYAKNLVRKIKGLNIGV